MDEMMSKLTNFFYTNNDLKIFSMNGSKINENISQDIFQDYDVVFFTNDVMKYKQCSEFLNYFGEILIVTEPEDDTWSNLNKNFPKKEGYFYLVQFKKR